VLLHLMAGSKEDAETVSAFFQDMRARSSSPSRPAFAQPASVAWRTACAIWRPRCRKTSGRTLRRACTPASGPLAPDCP
jgi:hypothetical protein